MKLTQKALHDICRAAEAVPPGNQETSLGGHSRSVLSQMQEIAISGAWFIPILKDREPPVFDEHAQEELKKARSENDSIAKCIASAKASTTELCALISTFPESALEDEIELPFGGGTTVTMADLLEMHRWNMVYHLGQINLIQLTLGDPEMH